MRFFRIFLLVFLSCGLFHTALSQEVALGDAYVVGTTWWFNQQNSTTGKMIARDGLGGVHFAWTKGVDQANAERLVYYNFASDDDGDIADQLDENSARADFSNRSGYVSLVLHIFEEDPLAVVFYHLFGQAGFGIDFRRGLGAFESNYLEAPNQQIPISTKGAVDRNHVAHVISGVHDMVSPTFPLLLWNVVQTGGMDEWEVENIIRIDETTGLSHHIKAADESDQVAVVWHHNIVGVPAPDEWEGFTAHSMNNDLYIYESPDGEEWDFDEPFNITRTILPDPDREGVLVFGDTLRPFNDCDILYDESVAHVVFSVRGLMPDPSGEEEPPVLGITTRESFIWHWDSDSDSLTLVADGWYENDGDPGSQHNNVSRPSLGMDEDGVLYCIFRQVTEDDQNEDGYCHGELMLSISQDAGITWSESINLTETVPEDDRETEYVDECHPSIADLVDDDLHITYLLAPETSGSPVEGVEDECVMIYQRVAVEDLPEVDDLPMPRQGFQYHNRTLMSVDRETARNLPETVSIEAYPNPFNNVTTLSYTLTRNSRVSIRVYDLNGKLVETLMEGEQVIGAHDISWNGRSVSSGVYIVEVESNGIRALRKLVLMR